MLRPGGILISQTPNATSLRRYLFDRRWNRLAPDRHVLLHSLRSLQIVLETVGFEPFILTTVSGPTTDRKGLRILSGLYGSVLARFRLGNGIWCASRRKETG